MSRSSSLAILVFFVRAGIDDHYVALAHDFAGSPLQFVVGDRLRFPFGSSPNAAAEKMRQRHFVDEWSALHDMVRCVDVRGVVHRVVMRGDSMLDFAMEWMRSISTSSSIGQSENDSRSDGTDCKGEPHGRCSRSPRTSRCESSSPRESLTFRVGRPSSAAVQPLCTRILVQVYRIPESGRSREGAGLCRDGQQMPFERLLGREQPRDDLPLALMEVLHRDRHRNRDDLAKRITGMMPAAQIPGYVPRGRGVPGLAD